MGSKSAELHPNRIADQVEIAYLNRRRRVTRSMIESVVSKLRPEMAEDELERSVSLTVATLRGRQKFTGSTYPLKWNERRFDPSASLAAAHVHEFLALLSAYPTVRRRVQGHKPDLLFESVTARALARYTGGVAHVFSSLVPGRGMRVKLGELGRMLGVESFPLRARPERYDNGLDVVSWRKFPSTTAVFPVVIAQCTIGAPDPVVKARETSERDWADLLDLPQQAFVTAYAIPHILPTDWGRWRDLRNATELALDRSRLLHLLDEEDFEHIAGLPSFGGTLNWMRSQVPPEHTA